ncbi:hypothetical protein [Miltoncostaea marina]|uniref:hypothetical protein n=1 Tax=Miltoncostaea marina TaxID=2843215 RepID=UPI001C3CD3F8|nr:hypothetical protein [Miltoncostaea marina]
MTQGPAPAAAFRGFMALVLDMVRVDPDRRPTAEMLRWHRDLAGAVGVAPGRPATNQELLDGALRLKRAIDRTERALTAV